MAADQDYTDRLPLALLQFQFLEEVLKQYILRAHILIACRTQDALRFAVDADAIWQMPLGKLASSFQRLCPNQELATRIKKVVKTRNLFAHAGYVIPYDQMVDEAVMRPRVAEVELITHEVEKLVFAVVEEGKNIERSSPAIFEEITKLKQA